MVAFAVRTFAISMVRSDRGGGRGGGDEGGGAADAELAHLFAAEVL